MIRNIREADTMYDWREPDGGLDQKAFESLVKDFEKLADSFDSYTRSRIMAVLGKYNNYEYELEGMHIQRVINAAFKKEI